MIIWRWEKRKSKEGCGLFCFWLSFFQIKLFVWMLRLSFLIFLGWFKRCSFKVYILGPTQHSFLILHSYPRDICVFISLIYLNPIYVCVCLFSSNSCKFYFPIKIGLPNGILNLMNSLDPNWHVWIQVVSTANDNWQRFQYFKTCLE